MDMMEKMEREKALRLGKDMSFIIAAWLSNPGPRPDLEPAAKLALKAWLEFEPSLARQTAPAAAVPDDTKRLNWLDAQWADGIHVEVCASNHGRGADSLGRFATVFTRRSGGRASSNIRDAIDEAMLSAAPGARSKR